jgi:hypothetical protein
VEKLDTRPADNPSAYPADSNIEPFFLALPCAMACLAPITVNNGLSCQTISP